MSSFLWSIDKFLDHLIDCKVKELSLKDDLYSKDLSTLLINFQTKDDADFFMFSLIYEKDDFFKEFLGFDSISFISETKSIVKINYQKGNELILEFTSLSDNVFLRNLLSHKFHFSLNSKERFLDNCSPKDTKTLDLTELRDYVKKILDDHSISYS